MKKLFVDKSFIFANYERAQKLTMNGWEKIDIGKVRHILSTGVVIKGIQNNQETIFEVVDEARVGNKYSTIAKINNIEYKTFYEICLIEYNNNLEFLKERTELNKEITRVTIN